MSGMFDFKRATAPFFTDRLTVSGTRSGRSFYQPVRGCVTAADLVDPQTGIPCGDREWTAVIPFGEWVDASDPRRGDEVRLDDGETVLRVVRVEIDRTSCEYVLTCHEARREARRGID